VTATAVDSADQTGVSAISLRGTPPAAPPAPVVPAAPPEPEDRPPSVAFTGPVEGVSIAPSSPPVITADAGDDRGVAQVVFMDDGKVICTDPAAPYECPYAPDGGDVGRNTLIAVAVDGAGQTSAAFRGVSVGRFGPRLTARTTPRRDRRRPYRYTTSGSVVLPTGVTSAQACADGGTVSIEFTAGRLRLPMTTTLRADCTYRSSIAFPSRRSLGRGRLAVRVRFAGNGVLVGARARTQTVRAG
jgi:hypothetical protein